MIERERPRVLIVGPGAIARRHVENFRSAGAKVVAVAGRDLGRARAFADELGIGEAYEGHRAALDGCDAQIVSVATPPAAHPQPTIDALQAGHHVLCEKPFAMTSAEAWRMVEAAEQAQRLLGCWSSRHHFLWGPATAIRLAQEGAFGRVVHVHVDFQWRDLVPGISFQPECRWFLDSSRNGGGVLADWGGYWLDLVLTWLGRHVRPVAALGSTFLGMDHRPLPPDVLRDAEELCTAMVTFDDGSSAVLQLASRLHQDIRHQMRIWGTKGGASLNPFDTGPEAVLTLYRDVDGEQRTEQLIADGPRSMHDGPAADFIEAVATGRPPMTDGTRAARVTEIIEAIYRSARQRRPVEIGAR